MRLAVAVAVILLAGCEPPPVTVEPEPSETWTLEDVDAVCVRSCAAQGYETGTWCDCGPPDVAHLMICACHAEAQAKIACPYVCDG